MSHQALLGVVHSKASQMLESKTSILTKLQVKCWVYHSESRVKNGHEPFSLFAFSHDLPKSFYVDYITLGLISCDDIGGKDHVLSYLEDWFN